VDFQKIYDDAHKAGMKAGEDCIPTPMTVVQHANMADDKSAVVKQWHIPQGVCGFAWIKIRPANCSFAKWIKKNNLGRNGYDGGIDIWVHEFGQSMEMKEAYANAFAVVLEFYGIKAFSGSRMD